MIDTILNLMFRCSHRRLTRPVTPAGKSGAPHEGAYVVCLDCGKHFAYDTKEMRIGKAIPRQRSGGVQYSDPLPEKSGSRLRYALWASVPLALIAGIVMNGGKKQPGETQKGKPAPEKKPATAPKA